MFVSRHSILFMQVFESGVGDCCEFFSRVIADHTANGLCVRVEICGALACLGSESDTLGQGRQMFAGGNSQRFDRDP